MHYTLDGADGMSRAGALESHPVHMSAADPVVSLQTQLLLNGLHYSHPQMAASTAGMDAFANTMNTSVVASPSLASVYESHQVPRSPASSVFSHPAISAYSPFVSDVSSPGSAASPHTPRSTVRSLLAEKKIKTEQPSSTPSPEVQLEQLLDIKPLLRKPIDTSRMTSDQINRLHRRRERNKAAATRCRIKRREKSHNIRSDLTEYSSANDELEREILRLQEEKHKLETLLAVHTRVQKCHISSELDDFDFQSTASPSDCSVDSDSNTTLVMTASPIDVKPQVF